MTDRFPNKLPGIANHNAMQIDPIHDIIVVSVHAHNELLAIDLADRRRGQPAPLCGEHFAGFRMVSDCLVRRD